MPKIEVVRYRGSLLKTWDSFVGQAKNGVFLFLRDYVEYHADRFDDHSLLVRDGGRTIAVVPANSVGDTLQSHGGLTFGGVICDRSMSAALMMDVFDVLARYLQENGISRMVYKRVPHIYHSVPADEDLYALFRSGATLVRRDVSSTIDARERLPFTKGRRYSIGKARTSNLRIGRSLDFDTFMEMEAKLLLEKHGAKPTHTAQEMSLLASRFPENIKLFAASEGTAMVGGVIIYESPNVAHTQYIASTNEGRQLHALDLLLDHLINKEYKGKRYFDFGISTEKAGRYLNAGLSDFKEGFGARAIAYDSYEWELKR